MADETQQPDLQAQVQDDQTDEDIEAQLAYEQLKRRREAKKRKRILILAIVGAVALVGVIVFIAGQANKDVDQDGASNLVTSAVRRGDFATTVSANGATEPVNSTVVTPEVDGIIEDLRVQEGSTVSEGDVLFTLKNESLDKAIREANTELQTAQRAADKANHAVDEAYAAYNRAVDYGNETDDWSGFDEAALKEAISTAEDAFNTAVDALNAARTKVSEAQTQADKRTVRAPVSGTIVSMSAKNGAAFGSVTGGTGSASSSSSPLIQISDLSQMKVTVQVNEVDISSISVGQEAVATFSALPSLSLKATVERIASVSSGSAGADGSAGGSGGVVTYAVDLLIPDPDSHLKPGMTATVAITTQSEPNTLIVPTSALSEGVGEDGSTAYHVTVVDDSEQQTTHEVPVEVLVKNTSEAAVKGALNEGDLVLMSSAGTAGATGAAASAGAQFEEVAG